MLPYNSLTVNSLENNKQKTPGDYSNPGLKNMKKNYCFTICLVIIELSVVIFTVYNPLFQLFITIGKS